MSQHRRTSRHPLSMTLHQTWTHLGLGASLKSLDHFLIEVNSGLKKKKTEIEEKKENMIIKNTLSFPRLLLCIPESFPSLLAN